MLSGIASADVSPRYRYWRYESRELDCRPRTWPLPQVPTARCGSLDRPLQITLTSPKPLPVASNQALPLFSLSGPRPWGMEKQSSHHHEVVSRVGQGQHDEDDEAAADRKDGQEGRTLHPQPGPEGGLPSSTHAKGR